MGDVFGHVYFPEHRFKAEEEEVSERHKSTFCGPVALFYDFPKLKEMKAGIVFNSIIM